MDKINIYGARENNLKNINLSLPKDKYIVFSGVSGSGKTTLAMDTIYAEGQRRYLESLSSYARQFLGELKRPDVDKIEGLSPAISIAQKTVSHNPRSTIGTITEIYDYLRLLYSRIGIPHCPNCGKELTSQSIDEIVDLLINNIKASFNLDHDTEREIEKLIKSNPKNYKLIVNAVPVNDRKGEFRSIFEELKKEGWYEVRVDNEFIDLSKKIPELDKNKKHTIEVIIDKFVLESFSVTDDFKETRTRIFEATDQALEIEPDFIRVFIVNDKGAMISNRPKDIDIVNVSTTQTCPNCNISLPEFEPRHFSFNSPHGACPKCNGLGSEKKIDPNKILNKNLSIAEGGVIPYKKVLSKNSWTGNLIVAVAQRHDIPLNHATGSLEDEDLDKILYGTGSDKYTIDYKGNKRTVEFEGIIPNLERRYRETNSDYVRKHISKYLSEAKCSRCNGARLNEKSLAVLIDNRNIAQVSSLPIRDLHSWISKQTEVEDATDKAIAHRIAEEVETRTKFLNNVGLSYLSIDRTSGTLSGGESQRIRLASQIGTGLTGVLYVLDEPSIGLHARDQRKLIETLKSLRSLGNTVIVVEHDQDTILNADHVVDFGPAAGEHGGEITAQGEVDEILKDKDSLTGAYLSGRQNLEKNVEKLFKAQVQGKEMYDHDNGTTLSVRSVNTHNLKKVDVDFPVGKFTCVTGVSGAGKSSLVTETLLPAVKQSTGYQSVDRMGKYEQLSGYENIERVVFIDQSPIGQTPRSNPATYTKTFDYIRDLFENTRQAKLKGYSKTRFSFNTKGGRCEACQGMGKIKVDMQFMPDMYIDCDVCDGQRYTSEVLEIKYKDKNIAEVLEMTAEEALVFFDKFAPITNRLECLVDVGLGYIKLGQSAPTLSGGESQRVKLASELHRTKHGSNLYILDEPTTGLHFRDMEKLIAVLKKLSYLGDTVIAIEHNLDFIKQSDWIIDLGPEGGDQGGEIIFEGTVEEIKKNKDSYTGQCLLGMN
jgi:excinuclease ABC subunit A